MTQVILKENKRTQPSEKANVTDQPTTEQKKPKGLIRWSGVLILSGLIGGGYATSQWGMNLLFKPQIEHYASQAWGAKVELGDLRLSLSPLALSFKQIQLTDPNKPMENLVVIEQLEAEIDFYQFVVNRWVINHISFTGLQLHQARQTSGALPIEAHTTTEVNAAITEPSTDGKIDPVDQLKSLISPEDLLARESLETLTQAKAFKQQLQTVNENWQAVEQKLPSKQTLLDYKRRYLALTNKKIESLEDLAQREAALQQLNQELKQERQTLLEAKQIFSEQLPALNDQFQALRKLPAKDFERLKQTYQLNEQGASNLVYLLFGPQIQNWFEQGMEWYALAQPYLESDPEDKAETAEDKPARLGQFVAFTEKDPQPDFRIKQVEGSAQLDEGTMAIHVWDINTDQVTSQLPIRFSANLTRPTQPNALIFEGQNDATDPQALNNYVNFYWDQYQIKDWQISNEAALPLNINQGQAHTQGQLRFLDQQQLAGQIQVNYSDIAFTLSEQANQDTQTYLAPVFDKIREFDVRTDISGNWYAPKIGLASNLDSQVSSALSQTIKTLAKAYQAELGTKLQAKTDPYIQDLETQLSNLAGEELNVKSIQAEFAKMSEENLKQQAAQLRENFVNEQKAKANRKVTAEKEKREREAKAKIEAEKRKREAEAKKAAEEKLQNMFKF